MTKITGRILEESGIETGNPDSDLLCSACQIASKAAQGLQVSHGKLDWIILLQALADLTIEQVEAGVPEPTFGIECLRNKCAEIDTLEKRNWQSEDENTCRKKLGNAWKTLQASIPGIEGNMRGRARKERVAATVDVYEGQVVGDKRGTAYGLRVKPLTLPEAIPVNDLTPEYNVDACQSVSIEYMEEMEVYPIPGIRHPIAINVRGWRSLFMVLPLAVVLISLVLGLWLLLQIWLSSLPVRDIFHLSVTIAIIASLLAWVIWPLYRLVDQRIVMAPNFLQLTIPMSHVLVIRTEGEERVVRMIRYTGRCSLCDGSVEIQAGKGMFKGRYVGVCDRNSIEHVFSFDHILLRGKHLFSN